MRYWEKVLRHAPKADKDRLEQVVLMLEQGKFPRDTIKLSDAEIYRVRVGNWRIQFHYYGRAVVIDDVSRRNKNTYN